jgi:hypothetical protein
MMGNVFLKFNNCIYLEQTASTLTFEEIMTVL